MVPFELEILQFSVAAVAHTVGGLSLLICPGEHLELGGALGAHALAALPAVMSPDSQVKKLFADFAVFQLVEPDSVHIELIGETAVL